MTIPRPLLIALFSLAASLLVGQRGTVPTTKPQSVYNRPGAPLLLTAKGTHDYSIDNVSKDRIVSYRLGCVRVPNGSVIIVKSTDAEKVDWPPGSGVLVLRTGQSGRRLTCEHMDSLFSIIEVQFADGRVWKATNSK